MPFIKPSNSTKIATQSPSKIFVGRDIELNFFVNNILKPEYPTHNIISISGQGGVCVYG